VDVEVESMGVSWSWDVAYMAMCSALQWLEVLAEEAQKPRLVVFIPKMLAGLQSSLVPGFTA
jgi:hypothetical protein